MEKVIDLEDRIPTLRQRRKRRTNFKFIILTTIFALVLLFLLYLQSSYSKIQTITIEGDKIEQQDFYIEQAGFAIGDSIWSFKPHQVGEKIEELEWVREVEVKRHLLKNKTTISRFLKTAIFLIKR